MKDYRHQTVAREAAIAALEGRRQQAAALADELAAELDRHPSFGTKKRLNEVVALIDSLDTTMIYVRATKADLQQEVEKMRAQYKAPVAESDVPAIVAYLADHKGVK